MEGLIIKTTSVITPWMEAASASPVLGVEVGETLRLALREVGALVVHDVDESSAVGGETERVIATDDLWVTRQLLVAFLKAARAGAKPSVLAVEEGLFTEFTQALQDLGTVDVGGAQCRVFPLVWLPAGSQWRCDGDPALNHAGLEPLVIGLDVEVVDLPVHSAMDPRGKIELPMTPLGVMRINHWIHIVRVNQLALMCWGAELMKLRPMTVLWAAIRAMSTNKWKVMRRLVEKGRGCDIHPSAVVEASTLGEGVVVGANAIVRYSHLGDGVTIADQCNVQYSVLGKGASVSKMGLLQGAVLYPGANTGHHGVQLSVVGRDTLVGAGVYIGDFRPKGDIRVLHRGKVVSTGTNMMGCAIGHDCRILLGVITQAGREVPNGAWLFGNPRDVIKRIPSALPEGVPHVADNGVLISFDELKTKKEGGE